MAFIKGEKPKECVFCQKAKENGKDESDFVLSRGKTCFAILNLYPYSTGHVLVIPYRHTSDFTSLTQEESCEMLSMAQQTMIAITKTFAPDGYNLGMNLGKSAGAGIEQHLHLHIVPRWDGDNNFMPVVGNVKVHPTDLQTVFKLISGSLSH
jgi:ATP adenylyltransferase